MRAAVTVFPGSNCDRDMLRAFEWAGFEAVPVWHKETALPGRTDVVGVPGGFSFGDYLRCGAISARAPVMSAVRRFAEGGGPVLGVCNGFQVLCEAGLLPGALVRNAGITFVCRPAALIAQALPGYGAGARVTLPVAHHDGNYVAAPEVLDRLEGEGRVALRYAEEVNGSARDIAGIASTSGRVIGLMPHPERAVDPALGPADGRPLFAALARMAAPA